MSKKDRPLPQKAQRFLDFAHKHWLTTVVVLLLIALIYTLLPGRYVRQQQLVAAYQQSATATKKANESSPTSVSATFGMAPTSGNLLVAVVGGNGNTTINTPAGFFTAINQSGTISQAIFYKVSNGTETTITATVSANPGSIGLQVYEYSGVNALDQVNSSSGTGTTPSSGTINTLIDNEVILAFFTADKNSNTNSGSWNNVPGEGFTQLNDFKTTGSCGSPCLTATYNGGENLVNTAGAHSVQVTISANSQWRGQIVSFISTSAPYITNVTSTAANGTYGVGAVIPIQIVFSQPVNVVGTPKLKLDTGGPGVFVDYTSGSGTNTLTFTYTVAAGQNSPDLSYENTGSLDLNGGTIKSFLDVDADTTLPAPSAAGSLNYNKNIVIDTTAPVLAEVTPVTTPTSDNTPNYTFSSTEEGTISYGGDCSSATASAVVGNNSITFNPLSDGVHNNCTIIVTDAAGNASNTLNITSFTVDTAAPVLSVITPVTTPTADNTPNFTFNSTEPGLITYGGSCNSSTTTAVSGNNTVTFDALADGTYSNCTITVTDSAGNVSLTLNIPSFTIDTTAPVLAEITPVPTPTNDNTPNYTFSSTEAGNIIYGGSCSSSTTVASIGNNTITFNTLADGTYSNCTITVTDSVGNTSNTLNISSFTIDTTPPSGPTISEVSAVPNPTNNSTPSYTFSSTDAGTITYGGDCSSATTLAFPGNNLITFNFLADGLYNNCTITVTDGSSNPSNLLTISAFVVDTIAPSLSQVIAVPSPTNDNTPSYTFNTTEGGTITYGGTCSSLTTVALAGDNTITFNTLLDGTYSNCTITVTDNAGNISSILNVNSFIVDTTAPVLVEVTAVPSPTNDNTPSYTFSSSEGGTITYGGDCSSSTTTAFAGNNTITFDPLSDGTHNNCTITVTDSVGNVSLVLNVNAFIVDTVLPGDIIDLSTSAVTANSVTLNWTAPGDNANVGTAASYQIRYSTSPINSGNFAGATLAIGIPLPQLAGTPETFIVNGLTANTTYYFAIVSFDAAGNSSSLSNVPSATTLNPVTPPTPPSTTPVVTGAGNVSGIGQDACVGQECARRDFRSVTAQKETVAPPQRFVAPSLLNCGRKPTENIPFLDIDKDPNKSYIEDIYRKCIVDGRTANLFVPEGNVTRAEFLKVILNMYGIGTAEYKNTFEDVSKSDWFAPFVAKAVEKGMIQVAARFRPNDPVTRSEALKIIISAKGVSNLEGYHASFADSDEENWFYHYAAYAQARNLLGVKSLKVGKSGKVGNLYSFTRTLKQSDIGKDVRDLKEILAQMNIYKGEINNVFDQELAQAVLNYQSSRGIRASGHFDFQTQAKLMDEDLSPRETRYFLPEKYLTRSELSALVVLINR